MHFFNNNNSRSEECTLVSESFVPNQYGHNHNKQLNDYQYDPNGNLNHKIDGGQQSYYSSSKKHINIITDSVNSLDGSPTQSHDRLNKQKNWLSTNGDNKCVSSFHNSVLYQSDDEALETYLNDLAKNYDDIDRRIRDAERFVSQIEEAQIGNQIPTSNNFDDNCSFSKNKIDDSDPNNKVKYVTELRVNIADKVLNDNYISHDIPFTYNDKYLKSKNTIGSQSFSLQKSTGKSATPRGQERIPPNRSLTANMYSNPNYQSQYLDSYSFKSNSSQSNSNKGDMDPSYIPPPYLFTNRAGDSKINKEVQTTEDFTKLLCTPNVMVERSVQTMSPVCCTIKATIDTGVGPDSKYYKLRSKAIGTINTVSKKISDSYDSEITETDITNQTKSPINYLSDNRYGSSNTDDSESEEQVQHKPIKLRKQSKKNIILEEKNKDFITQKHPKISKEKKSNTKNYKSRNWKKNHQFREEIKPTESPLFKELETYDKFEAKDSTQNASYEIQKLLENLGNHLQATMSIKEPKIASNKPNIVSVESPATSFWDNPLYKNDLTTKKLKIRSNTVREKSTLAKCKSKKSKSATINSELQAICKNIEKDRKYDDEILKLNKEFSSIQNESSLSGDNEKSMLKSDKLNERKQSTKLKSSTMQGTSMSKIPKNSSAAIILSTDNTIMNNFKVSRTFELSSYDDLIKSHLSPFDRRVKSVAAKNGCRIAIDGPFNAYDPSSCQAFKNKITYKCTIAGQSKENLDKCVNYLKETFPNSFLRVNQRSG